MTWFKVDDSFYDHPKVFDAPDCAVALWTRAGTWSARNLTNGFVPAGMPARLCDDPDTAVKELVRRGLWSRATGGFQFHDWRDYQPTAEAVRALREKRAAAGRKGGQAKAAVAKGKQTSSKPLASASPVAKQNATPTRPPSYEVGGKGSARHASRGAARAPRDDTHAPPNEDWEDPKVLDEDADQLRHDAEAKVRAIAELQERTKRGAAAARAALPTRGRPTRDGPSALERLLAIPTDPQETP